MSGQGEVVYTTAKKALKQHGKWKGENVISVKSKIYVSL